MQPKTVKELAHQIGVHYGRDLLPLSDWVDGFKKYVLPILLSISFMCVMAMVAGWALLVGVEIGFNLVILLI